MNLEKVIFGFFVVLACTLNFGFFVGDMTRHELHHPGELFAAVVVNLIALVLKFGDRTQIGAIHLGTSLAACLQLVTAAVLWRWVSGGSDEPVSVSTLATVVSLSGGALVANAVSVVLLIGETLRQSR